MNQSVAAARPLARRPWDGPREMPGHPAQPRRPDNVRDCLTSSLSNSSLPGDAMIQAGPVDFRWAVSRARDGRSGKGSVLICHTMTPAKTVRPSSRRTPCWHPTARPAVAGWPPRPEREALTGKTDSAGARHPSGDAVVPEVARTQRPHTSKPDASGTCERCWPPLRSCACLAAIVTILGSPVIAAIILIEAAGPGGPRLPLILLPGLMSAGIGSVVFTGMGRWIGLSSSAYALSPFSLPAFSTLTVAESGWAIALEPAALPRDLLSRDFSTAPFVK